MAHSLSQLLQSGPIQFGTDGWRGVIAADFTFERLYRAAIAAAQVLAETYPETGSREVIVGHDRRFLSEEFAKTTAAAVRAAGLEPLLTDGYAPTPAFSWAVKARGALGALVITASHNPGIYSGLKLKGAFGGSVPPTVTQQVESRLNQLPLPLPSEMDFPTFDPWQAYCEELRTKVNIAAIRQAIEHGKLTLFADVMHGAAASGLSRFLGVEVMELRGDRDPLFGGGAPEPLAQNIGQLIDKIRAYQAQPGERVLGLVFDGDADRIAAVDAQGNFMSSQVLIPILIEHLGDRRGFTGEVVKSVSGSDLMPKVAEIYGRSIFETPVGYKYIADRMLVAPVLIGGEESGGIGYGNHIPERDALLSALYVLEAVVQADAGLETLYERLQEKTQFYPVYDRIDLPLADQSAKDRVQQTLETAPPTEIANQSVVDCNRADGFKFRLADGRWLMIRFSGTEPLLRLYCEAGTVAAVQETLGWARDWATKL
jgi:phosphomannomutase